MADRRDTGRRGIWAAAALVLIAFLLGGVAATVMVRRGWNPAVAPAPAVPTAIVVKPVVQAPAPATALAARSDPATLAVREGVLAGQLAALEARTAAISADALAAGGQAGRAEALLVVAGARRAVDRGTPLGYLDPQLRARFGAVQPHAVQLVLDAAHQPLTLEDLRQGLDAIAADLTTGAAEGWGAVLRHQIGSLVVLRDAGTPSPLPVDRLERARRLLDGGQVEAAGAEVKRLPGAGGAGKWLDAARRYALARRALDALEATALAGHALPPR